jgi:hypothetical protein
VSNPLKPNPNVPSIPQPVADLGALTVVAQSLKQGVDSLGGSRGKSGDRAVTFNDLASMGLTGSLQPQLPSIPSSLALASLAVSGTALFGALTASGVAHVGSLTTPGVAQVGFLTSSGAAQVGSLTATHTGKFWQTAPSFPSQAGASISRLADRSFVGAATLYDGNYPNLNETWVSQIVSNVFAYLETYGTQLCYSATGLIGGLFASRVSDAISPGGTIPIAAMVYNDKTTAPLQDAWIYYGTGVRAAGAGSVHCEIDVGNLGNIVDITPYSGPSGNPGFTIPLTLSSGGEASTKFTCNPCSAAIAIGANGGTFRKGIVFDSNIGTGVGISFPNGMEIQWTTSADGGAGTTGYILASSTHIGGIEITDTGMYFKNQSGVTWGGIAYGGPNTVNYLGLSPSLTGAPLIISANGLDSAINILIQAKGATGGVFCSNFISTGHVDFTGASVTVGGATATLTNSPTAGNPVEWMTLNVNGNVRHIPMWA